jgi:hypothetical protein
MRRVFGLALGFSAALPAAAPGLAWDIAGFTYLGRNSLSSNDMLGDGDDRWQTGGGTRSFMFGPEGTTGYPGQFGRLVEIRARTQVVSPDNFEAPAVWDRPVAAVITATANSHFEMAGVQFSAGAGIAVTGPQTRLIDIQNLIHELTPADEPLVPDAVMDAQIPNGFYATVHGEAARPVRIDEHLTLRPFVEGQYGVESFARIGADLMIGNGFDNAVLVREGTTGLPYHGIDPGPRTGVSFVIGADTARVFSSALLPASRGVVLEPQRHRVRAGMLVEHERLSVYYGVSWLSPEFAAQPTGQVVGAYKIKFRF